MTIAYIDVAKAPVQVPVIDLLQEPQGAAFDFISGQAWIVDKVNPANTMLRNIGDVLTNPGASPTKLLRRKSGLLESAPWWANEYDLAGNPMGMRAEAQRTNLFPRSQRFNTVWDVSGAVAGFPQFLAPDATLTATRLVENTDTGTHQVRTTFATSPSASESFRFFAKASGRKVAQFQQLGGSAGAWLNAAASAPSATVNLETGAIVSQSGSPTIVKVNKLLGGWIEVELSAPTSATATTIGMGIRLCDDAGAVTYTGDGVSGIEIWGFQRESGSAFPSSYIPTDGASVTRAADQPQIVTGFLPFSGAEGTLIFDGMGYDYNGAGSPTADGNSLQLTGSGTRYIRVAKADTGSRNSNLSVAFRNGNQDGLELANLSFPVAPNPRKVGATWGAMGESIASGAANTVAEKVGATMTFPATFTSLVFGAANGIMWYRSAIYIPRKLTAAELLARVMAA